METRHAARQGRRPPAVHRGSTHASRLQLPLVGEIKASECSELRLGCHPETPVIEPCLRERVGVNAHVSVREPPLTSQAPAFILQLSWIALDGGASRVTGGSPIYRTGSRGVKLLDR